ncbi:MAG: hypothetical protein NVSMB56_05040 [Pyrinomonadaceae bacterium]
MSQPVAPVAGNEGDTGDEQNHKKHAILLSQIGVLNETQSRAMQHGQPASWNNLSANITGMGHAQPLSAGNLLPQIPTPQQLTQRNIVAQRAVKIGIKRNGWYRVAQRDLIAAGFDPEAYSNFLQLYVDGQEVPIIVSNERTGVFGANDYIEFYGLGLNTPTADTHIYYLIAGARPGRRIATFNVSSRKHSNRISTKSGARNFENSTLVGEPSRSLEVNNDVVSGRRVNPPLKGLRGVTLTPDKSFINDTPLSFPYTVERKERLLFFGGLLVDGDNFFGSVVSSSPTTQNLTVTNLDPNGQASLQIAIQGVTFLTHKVKVALNGTDVGTLTFDDRVDSMQTFNVPAKTVREGDNSVVLTATGDPANGQTDVNLIDYVRLTYAHTYRADSNALAFSIGGGQSVKVDNFNSPNLRVIDITSPTEPLILAPRVETSGAASSVTVDAPSGGTRTLYAFVDGASETPTAISKNQPSTLARPENAADFVIITHGNLRDTVEPLRQLRASQGLNVSVVDIEDIYDEFSYGAHDPQAITEFFRYALSNWQTRPRFALLVGDATYDPRDYLRAVTDPTKLSQLNRDLLPTKLVVTIYSKTASDDALADLTCNDSTPCDGLAALGIGRLPAQTPAEAQVMISKTVNYSPTKPAHTILFVADSTQPDYSFVNENNSLRPYIPQDITIQTVNRDEGSSDTTKLKMVDGINRGPLIVNYGGHGAYNLLGKQSPSFFTTDEARALMNGDRLPFFSMMTCLIGVFQEPYANNDSLAETLMKNPNGGAIAVWGSSGLTVPTGQTIMNNELYRQIFGSNAATLGEMIRQAKTVTDDVDVRRTWILFGDPTLRLR